MLVDIQTDRHLCFVLAPVFDRDAELPRLGIEDVTGILVPDEAARRSRPVCEVTQNASQQDQADGFW